MTNLPDPIETRMITDLPRQLDLAVRPYDAAAIARVATGGGRPSVLRIIGATAVLAVAAVTAVVAVEALTGARNQLGGPSESSSATSTPAASEPAALTVEEAAAIEAAIRAEQLASIERADGIINTNLSPGEIALVVNAEEKAVEECMQELGWDWENGTVTPEDTGDGFGAMARLDRWTFADVASAESVGYGLESHLGAVSAFIDTLDTGGEGRRPDEDNMSPEEAERYWLDFFGTDEERVEITERDGSHSGLAGGGCMGGSMRAVWGDIANEMTLRDARDMADSDIWRTAVADQAVVDALDSWRRCVLGRGLLFGDPAEAFESALTAAFSGDYEQERLIATTDAQCKAESSLAPAVQAAFLSATNALLADFEDDLIAYQQLEQEALARAREILNFEGEAP